MVRKKTNLWLGLTILAACCILLILSTETVHAATTYETEPNDEMYQANILPCEDGAVFKGTIWDDRGYDWVKVTMPQSGGLQFNVKADAQCAIFLYNAASFMDPESIAYIPIEYKSSLGYAYGQGGMYLSKGTYYARIMSYYDENTYNITLEYTPVKDDLKEPNDTIDAATPIVVNTKYSAMIAQSSMIPDLTDKVDVDFVKVNIPTTGTYYFDVRFRNRKGDNDFCVTEYNRKGDQVQKVLRVKENTVGDYTRGAKAIYLKKGTHIFEFSRDYYYDSWLPSLNTWATADTIYTFDISKKLSAVTNLRASRVGSGAVKLSWSKKSDATGYRIYRRSPSTGKYVYIGKTTKTTFTDKKAKAGRTNTYKIKAYRNINGYNELGFYSKAVEKKA